MDTVVEVKVCEFCGGNWLRAKGNPGVYCAPCRPMMDMLPIRNLPKVRTPRLPVRELQTA